MTDGEMQGRVAIVTGSSSGIGEAIAHRLSALGAVVVVNSSSSVEAGQAVSDALPGESIYVRADISDPAQGQALLDATVERFGHLDVLVNNAGWTQLIPHTDLEAVTDEVFKRIFEVNVFGTWALTKAAMPLLKQADDPNVIMLTSVAGLRPMGSSIPYAMSKAALNHLTALLAKSHAPVRVNAIAPGLVDTPWTADWGPIHEAFAAQVPMHRSATPDDCAEAALAILRNKYMTGATLVVDGGTSQVM
jgi:ketoreductase RED2